MKKIFKQLVIFYCVAGMLSGSSAAYASGAAYGLPLPGNLVGMSVSSAPALLKGIKVDRNDPFFLEFLFDSPKAVSAEEFSRMVEYFLACLTMPEENLYVNLSPYEPERVCADSLALTDLGKDMLEQDYLLKQLSASLTYPETEIGKKYWNTVNNHSSPANDFNKVWITPDKAVVYENEGTAVIKESCLRVLADEDYLAQKENAIPAADQAQSLNAFKKNILPLLEKDVNQGKNFSTLRQVYSAFILAVWFKKKLKDSVYRYYIDQKKISGIDKVDKQARQDIYNLYVEAFKRGAYDYIHKEYNPLRSVISKRRYFSGGVALDGRGVEIYPVARERVDNLVAGALGGGKVELVDGQTQEPFNRARRILGRNVTAVALAAGGFLAARAGWSAEADQDIKPKVELSATAGVQVAEKTTTSAAATVQADNGAALDIAADIYGGGRVDSQGILPLGKGYRLVLGGGYFGADGRRDGYGNLLFTPSPGASGGFGGAYYERGSLYNETTSRLVLRGGYMSSYVVVEGFVNSTGAAYRWSDQPDNTFSATTVGGILGSPGIKSQLYVASLGNGHIQAMANGYGDAVTAYAETWPNNNREREGEIALSPLKFIEGSQSELLFIYNYTGVGSQTDLAYSASASYNTLDVAFQGPLTLLIDGPADKGRKLVLWGSIAGRFGNMGGFNSGSNEFWGNVGFQKIFYVAGLVGDNHGNGNGNFTATTWRWAGSISPTNIARVFGLPQPVFGFSLVTENRYDLFTRSDKTTEFRLRSSKNNLSLPLPYDIYIDGGAYVYRVFPGEQAAYPNGATHVNAFGGGRFSFTIGSIPAMASVTIAAGSGFQGMATLSLWGHYASRGDVSDAPAPLGIGRIRDENNSKAVSALTSKSVCGITVPGAKYPANDPRGLLAVVQMQNFIQGAKASPYSTEIKFYLSSFWGINLDAMDPQNLSAADQKLLLGFLRDPDLNIKPDETLYLLERVAALQRRAIDDPDGFGNFVKKYYRINLMALEKKDLVALFPRVTTGKPLLYLLEGIPLYGRDFRDERRPGGQKKVEAKPAVEAPVLITPTEEVKPAEPVIPVSVPASAQESSTVPLPDKTADPKAIEPPSVNGPGALPGEINLKSPALVNPDPMVEKPAKPIPPRHRRAKPKKKIEADEPLPTIIIHPPARPNDVRNVPAQPAQPAAKKGGTMGRWSYDRVIINENDGIITLVNAVRIERKDGVAEPEFLINGRNAPRDIVLHYRMMNNDERRRIVALKLKLGIDSHVKVYILRRDASARFHRMLGLADDAIFLREDILDQGNDEQLAEALDHESIERTAATHDQARGAQYQGGLTALIKSLIEQDKRYAAKHPEQFEKFGGIVFNKNAVALEGKGTEPFYVSPETAEGFKRASSVSFKILALYSRANGTQIAYNVR